MDINLGRNRQAGMPDAEIERDVAELRSLLAGIEGPKEPHPAYWQNFVVRVRSRIDEDGGRSRRRSFSTAWASVGAAAVVTLVVISGVLAPGTRMVQPGGETAVVERSASSALAAPSADIASQYQNANSQALILSGSDMRMINAIDSESDAALFEAMVTSDEL